MTQLNAQLATRISPEMKTRLDQACQERRVSQGEVVDAALRAFFDPRQDDESRYEVILKQLTGLRALMIELWGQGALGEPPAPVPEVPSAPPAESPRVASYEALYGPAAQWGEESPDEPVPEDFRTPAPKRSLWNKFLYKDGE